jgi:hypothetical protein
MPRPSIAPLAWHSPVVLWMIVATLVVLSWLGGWLLPLF